MAARSLMSLCAGDDDGPINGEWFRASVEEVLVKRGIQLPMPKATSIA
jgi:hypothetical protein